MLAHLPKHRDELFLTFSFLDAPEEVSDERQRFPAGCAPATRLPDEEFDQIQRSPNQASFLVEDNDGTGPQPVPALLQALEIHLDIIIPFAEKAGRGPPWKTRLEFGPRKQPARMFFDDFSLGCPHGKFIASGPIHLAANAVELRPGTGFGPGQTFEPLCPMPHDLWNIDQGFHII